MITIRDAVEDIEYVLSVHLRPSYMMVVALKETPGEINVIVSCNQFNGISVQKRVAIVFSLLNKFNSVIIAGYLIVVQCFDRDEMLDYIDNCFEENEDDQP